MATFNFAFRLLALFKVFQILSMNVGLDRYFQMKETAPQSDKVDRRYTGLKLGVLNKN